MTILTIRSASPARLFSGVGAAILLAALAGAPAQAGLLEELFAPRPDLWERWTAHDEDASQRIDHAAWDRFLDTHLSESAAGVNLVAYASVSDADRRALDAYLSRLQDVAISRFARAEQLAYWINFYNALTVSVVLDHYPVDSIRDIEISPGLLSVGPWDKKLVMVENESLSLNDIEHRILRPIWRDPRIHYAVNCAAMGCPNLRRTAFRADNADELLDRAAHEYVNSPRGARFEDGGLVVSSIYVWFDEDFGGDHAGIIEHLRRYARGALRDRLAGVTRIADDRYDWSLNESPPE